MTTLFLQEMPCALAQANISNALDSTNSVKKVEGSIVSEETKIVNFGSTQTAENIRLRNLFDHGYQDQAISEAVEHLQQTPQDITVRQTLAQFYSQQNKEELADRQLQLIQLWKIWNSGNPSLAISQGTLLNNKNPDNPDVNYTLGYFYFSQKHYSLASQEFQSVLKKNPLYIAAINGLINVHIATGNYAQAIAILDQSTGLNHTQINEERKLIQHAKDTQLENTNTDFNQFISIWRLWEADNKQEAISQAVSYLKKEPGQVQIALSLGQFYLLDKNYILASQQLIPIVENNPDYVAARVSLIDVYLATNNRVQAENTLNQGLARSPNNSILLEKQKIIKNYGNNTLAGSEASIAEFDSLWKIWDSGQQSEAITQAKSYLTKNPNDIRINLALGQFYSLQKKYPEAIQNYKSILTKNPTYTQAILSLSNAYVDTKNYEMADKTLNEGLVLLPNNSELVIAQKNIAGYRKFDYLWQLWNQNKHAQAINEAKNYIQSHPDNFQIALSLGQFYFLEKDYPSAYQQINQLLVKNPDYIGARVSLIDVSLAMKDYVKATNLLQEGLKRAPNDPVLLAEEEKIKNVHGNLGTATLPQVTTQNKGEALIQFNSIWKLWHSGEKAAAIKKADEYLKEHPDDSSVALSLGQFYFLEKKYDLALREIKSLLAKDPNYIAARASLIEVYIALKDYSQATEILNQSLKLAPNDLVLLTEKRSIENAKNSSLKNSSSNLNEFNALWELWKTGKQSQAIQRASNYLKQNPNDNPIALSLGQFYFLQNKYDQAIQEVSKVLAKDPNYIASRTTLIDLYLATKNYLQATVVLNQGLSLSPNNSTLLAYQQRIKNAQNIPLPLVTNIRSLMPQSASYVEGGALYANLTNGNGHWFNQYLKTAIQTDSNNVWQAEFLHGNEFNQQADYGLVQKTHNFNENWYGTLGAGISDNSIFVPKYYIGATLARRFLESKQLVVYLQAQNYWFRPVYTLEVINPGFIYYFKKPWIVESGVYLNRSNPGSIDTAVAYLAVTQGRDKDHYLSLRLGWGREGYLPLIDNTPVIGYPSIVVTGTWRQWLKNGWGWNIIAEDYHNSFYDRYNISFGLFKEFSV